MSCSMRTSVISRSSPEQELGEQLPLPSREARCRLVEHEEARLRRERHGDSDLPVLAVREIPDELVQLALDRDAPGGFACLLAHLPVAWEADRSETATCGSENGEVDRVLDRDAEQHAGLLIRPGEAGTRAVPCGRVRDVGAVQLDGAGRGWDVAGDDVEECRFPGPVRSENRSPFAVGDVQIDVTDGDETREAPADPPQAEGRLGVFEGLCCFAQRST